MVLALFAIVEKDDIIPGYTERKMFITRRALWRRERRERGKKCRRPTNSLPGTNQGGTTFTE